jgi:hypothetical protein
MPRLKRLSALGGKVGRRRHFSLKKKPRRRGSGLLGFLMGVTGEGSPITIAPITQS